MPGLFCLMNDEVQYVLDGGALLQHIPWEKGVIFKQICFVYADYVTRKYENAIVVFDGYQGIICSIVCGNCKGSGCLNSITKEVDGDDDAVDNDELL